MVVRCVLVGVVLIVGCAEAGVEQTAVRVTVDADQEVKSRATAVEVLIRSGTGGRSSWSERHMEIVEPLVWPFDFMLVPEGGNASRGFEVVVTASDQDGEFSRVRAVSTFAQGKVLALSLLLDRACIDFSITCRADQTCIETVGGAATCVDADIEATLEDAGGPVQDAGPDVSVVDSGDGDADSGTMEGGRDSAVADSSDGSTESDATGNMQDAEPEAGPPTPTPFQMRFSEQCKICIADVDCGSAYTCFGNECRRRCTTTGSADLSDAACGMDDSSIGLQCAVTSDSSVFGCKARFGTNCEEWLEMWADFL